MSQQNVEIVRELYSDARNLTEGRSDVVARDVEYDFTRIYPEQPLIRGVEELRRFRATGPWAGAPLRFTPERFFDVDGERVLVFVRVAATGQGSGAEVTIEVAHELTIRDAHLVRFKVYRDRDEALGAVGLSEH